MGYGTEISPAPIGGLIAIDGPLLTICRDGEPATVHFTNVTSIAKSGEYVFVWFGGGGELEIMLGSPDEAASVHQQLTNLWAKAIVDAL